MRKKVFRMNLAAARNAALHARLNQGVGIAEATANQTVKCTKHNVLVAVNLRWYHLSPVVTDRYIAKNAIRHSPEEIAGRN